MQAGDPELLKLKSGTLSLCCVDVSVAGRVSQTGTHCHHPSLAVSLPVPPRCILFTLAFRATGLFWGLGGEDDTKLSEFRDIIRERPKTDTFSAWKLQERYDCVQEENWELLT